MDRVQRVFLATGPRVDTQFLTKEHGDLLVAILGDDAASNSLLANFPASTASHRPRPAGST